MPSPKAVTLCLLGLGLLPLSAANGPEFPIGSVIQNFSLPQADASGKKTAVVHGKRATVVSPNQLKIEDLKVELFNGEGNVETTITATRSDFWRKENRLTTDTGINRKEADPNDFLQRHRLECRRLKRHALQSCTSRSLQLNSMKYIFFAFLAATSWLLAEDAPPPTPASSTNSSTTIESDSLDLNLGKKQGKKQGIFRGNVKVDEPRFTMTAKEMTVFFADNDAVESLEAREDVIIKRKDGSSDTSSEKALYDMSVKKLTLLKVTRQPKVVSKDKTVFADKIILYPEEDKMTTEGASRVMLQKAP